MARLVAGNLELDRDARRVRFAGRDVRLGPTDFRLLEYLMEKPGCVLARSQLLASVWGHSTKVAARTVDVHIGRSARRFPATAKTSRSASVLGSGYSFDETFGGE